MSEIIPVYSFLRCAEDCGGFEKGCQTRQALEVPTNAKHSFRQVIYYRDFIFESNYIRRIHNPITHRPSPVAVLAVSILSFSRRGSFYPPSGECPLPDQPFESYPYLLFLTILLSLIYLYLFLFLFHFLACLAMFLTFNVYTRVFCLCLQLRLQLRFASSFEDFQFENK